MPAGSRRTKLLGIIGLPLFVLIAVFLVLNSHSDMDLDILKQKYTHEASQFIAIDGMDVHYRDQGQGPTLLLVHGSNASLHTWEGWVDELENDYRLISLDLPGHGLTGPHPQDKYSWADTILFLDRFVKAVNLNHFSIAGNSRGGAIAWHYTLAFPEKINKLILIDSRGAPPDEPMPLSLRLHTMPVLKDLLTVLTPRSVVALSVADVFGQTDKVTETLVDRYFELSLRAGNREANIIRLNQPVDYSQFEKISSINKPTLILWGGKDKWILPKYASEFEKRIKDSKKIIYPELGHTPMEEAPQLTARDARLFLQE